MFGCEGLTGTKEDCLRAQIVELRCTIRRMVTLQAQPLRRNCQSEKEELELPLYEHTEEQFRPTGNYLSV